MKIAFDISDLATGRADGTTRYTYELAKRLPDLARNHQWYYLAPSIPESIRAICHPPQAESNAKPRSDSRSESTTGVTCLASPWPKYWTQLRLPFDLLKAKPDVLFMPIQQLPMLRPRKTKTVAVIHDLAVHKYPEQFTYKDWALLHLFSAQATREADHIIAVSQSTADDIAHYYGRTKNVHIIHHGVDHDTFRLPTAAEREQSWQALTNKYPQLTKPFILYVGQIQPRKNLSSLITALELLIERVAVVRPNATVPNVSQADGGREPLQLALAGSHGWLQQPILDRIKQSKCRDRIHLLGRVPDELLPALYWHADVFVLPSLYEGFGMPILEAQSSGCPVVTSHTSSMPEVAGPGAILVDPLKPEAIATGIVQARQQRDQLIKKGIQNAQNYTWEATAQETLKVIVSA